MKKYIQITFFLTVFGVLVLFKHIRGNNDNTGVIPQINNTQINPIPNQSNNPKVSYKNGTYTGSVEDAYYGLIQVQAVIANSVIKDINFLQYPNDNRTSRSINQQALPILRQEAIQSQNSQVDVVTGASDTSPAFERSLESALAKAK